MLASLLYRAADDCDLVDPMKVQAILGVSQQELQQSQKKKIMVKDVSQLTPRQIFGLATANFISGEVAAPEGYLSISDETIKNLQYEENKDEPVALNWTIIKYWANRNPERKVLVSCNFGYVSIIVHVNL